MTAGEEDRKYAWKRWKVAAVVLAGLLVAAGGILALASPGAGGEPGPAPAGAGGSAGAARGFGPVPHPPPGPSGDEELPGGTEPASSASPWSPALLRGGISFFVGLAVAFAFRTFLKLALLFAGIWAASLILLAQLGWVEVRWDLIDGAFAGWTRNLGAQFESFATLLTGSLPSAGMAALGLYTGFRRR